MKIHKRWKTYIGQVNITCMSSVQNLDLIYWMFYASFFSVSSFSKLSRFCSGNDGPLVLAGALLREVHHLFTPWCISVGGPRYCYSSFAFKTRNKMRVATESGKGMKVKVVKLCWNKCNGPFLMHIYDKQCGIMQIKPSQMEVAPLHRTFVISHKRRLFKNTKGI